MIEVVLVFLNERICFFLSEVYWYVNSAGKGGLSSSLAFVCVQNEKKDKNC